MTNVQCTGNERTLQQCQYVDWVGSDVEDGENGLEVGVICKTHEFDPFVSGKSLISCNFHKRKIESATNSCMCKKTKTGYVKTFQRQAYQLLTEAEKFKICLINRVVIHNITLKRR